MVWTLETASWNALLGRGLHPYSLWLCSIGLPTLALFWNLRKDDSGLAWLAWWASAMTAGWTIPPETLGHAIVDIGKFRAALADIIPILPAIAHKLPAMLLVVYPILPRLLPHVGTVAPHLHVLLPHADFLTRIIPKLSSRIEDLIPLVEKVGPVFGRLTPLHIEKLELIIDDVVENLDILAPHIDSLMPILADGILVAPKMMPHIAQVVPYLDALEKDLNWLLPFAETEGVEELLPLLDKVAPKLQLIQPFAEKIAPMISKIRPHIPHLVRNLDVLMEELNEDVIINMDPMLYWCGRFLPLADSMGILRSKTLLRAFMPMARFLPPVPIKRTKRLTAGVAENEKEGQEWWRHSLMDRVVTIGYVKKVGSVIYYVMQVDAKYAGEFRFKHIHELHTSIRHMLGPDSPGFPARSPFRDLTSQEIESRKYMLQKYLAYIMSDPEVCVTPQFVHFIKNHRRWSQELPVLKSPLLGSN